MATKKVTPATNETVKETAATNTATKVAPEAKAEPA